MPSSMKRSSTSVETSRDMGHVLGLERSSEWKQNLDAVKERIPSAWRGNRLSSQEKHGVRHSFSQPYIDPKCELRQNASGEKVAQSKSLEIDRKTWPGGRACDDNELVRHMSNLPEFLRKVEKGNTIQEKALNFGVLDWKRLEKWKYTERMPAKLPKRTSSSGKSFSSASGPPKLVPNLRKQSSSQSHGPSLTYSAQQPTSRGSRFSSPQRQPSPPHRSVLNPSLTYSAQQPMPRGSRFSSPQRQPSPPHRSVLNPSKKDRNGRYQIEEESVECIKAKLKETCDQEYQAAESFRIGRPQKNQFQQRVELYDRSSETNVFNSKTKDTEKDMVSEREGSSSLPKQGKHKISLLTPNKSAQGKMNERRFDEVKQASKCRPADRQNSVLPVPKHFHEKRCTESSKCTESRTSVDAQVSALTENRLSDFFSQELYSGEFSGDIPRSCPLPSSAVEQHISLTSQAIDVDICSSANSVKSKCSLVDRETGRPSISSISPEASNRKQAEVIEQPTGKGRAPSPTRRFSFSLGRMGRSLSFKDSSAVPPLSSSYTVVRSGPVRPEIALGIDNNSEKDQGNARNRGRSSPLRRLLDPLLKHKTAPETVQPSSESSRPMNATPRSTKGPSKDGKADASTFQALLQLTFRNGLPFFKLVVENSKDMLAAAVRKLPTSGKNDPCLIYSFYSVHEIKKKSMNWINQGSKSKTYSLGYNIIGQMKISNSSHLKANTRDTSECDARECVLYGADPAQVDKQNLEFLPNKEIAAIILKNQLFERRDFLQNSGIVVILPGGVHGMPIKGAPSSLISRWRSAGLCDCGGWDVGCKVRVLADSGKNSNILQESVSSSIDHVNLYVQGGEQKSKPVFSIKPFSNEFYSLELDASVSLLEAFATSVAYVTCWKFPEIIETKGESEAEHSPETGTRKTPNTLKEQIPAKYVTCPPLSPAGRI
ncbi:hypothetical protein ACS0TY_015862 [Phlomoides rotata]